MDDDEVDINDVVLSDKGVVALAGDMSEFEPEEAIIMRFIWSREMLELPYPTEDELQNLIDLYQRASMDMMLFRLLIAGELYVNSIEGESDNFVWRKV